MSFAAAALTVLNALVENTQESSTLIQGTGIELPMGFNGYIAPMHPGMDLANVQMTEPSIPVHGAGQPSTVDQLMGSVMSNENTASHTILEDMSGRIMDESA